MIRRRRATAFPRIAKYQTAATRRVVAENGSGQVSPRLRRQLGDSLANIFSDAGKKFYADSILGIKETMEKLSSSTIEDLKTQVKNELGNRGLKKASLLFKAWIQELTDELIQSGMKEVSRSLEDLASTAAAEFTKAPELEEGEEDLFGGEEETPPEDVEEVSEEPVAPAEEPGAEGTEGTEDLFPEEPEAALPAGTPAPAAPAPAATHDPFAPRKWKSVGPQKVKVADAATRITLEQLVEAAGGHEELEKSFSKAPAVIAHLNKAQTKLVQKLAQTNRVVEGLSPLQIMDYASKHWPH